MPSPTASVDFYHRHAKRLADCYDGLTVEQVHGSWLPLVPVQPGARALDVGAGCGRDACWLAQQGWHVTAVEPAAGMREIGQQRSTALELGSDQLQWIDDSLPALKKVPDERYQLILLSAVWMHLSIAHRPVALRRLVQMLADTGVIVMTLRSGSGDPERPMYPVSAVEVRAIAKPLKISVEELTPRADRGDLLERPEVSWQTVILRRDRDS
ncbi:MULTISPECIES: bifunctional 2-polyprenyl-6-hydroxyphenol methylase/3-demethylubiquinol 3-O-methyltransferase UbiG [unclassified Oceanobacter]|jgi:SAM-dependent methyltransferase|uniref:class I SAM-dependent methyltransferase n=2 Tax=Gammaproteobacteria TaxID=1236 RepID=UPI0026E329FF|nr:MULTISPECIES: class I SAM-dependent methyltransferase [unclassified Oceanobacter]MDO6682552.1 class I SAM-dependent methyltransferase [Oceanobacter sp. 5_MG-2023]MDP2608785.1 class I SAM-dependent methyltransferase [Oceanobacter sp. 1_MG-2023]MDP2611973.1 class I SAM-dependent methyltransferase [Oceanobacter sp. 2_MG-2023]